MLGSLHHLSKLRGLAIAYLAANDSADTVGHMVDDTVDEGQVIGGHTNRANEKMPVTAAGLEQIHVLAVHLGAGSILNLSAEGVVDGAGEGLGGNCALGRCHSSAGQKGRKRFPVHHLVDGETRTSQSQ